MLSRRSSVSSITLLFVEHARLNPQPFACRVNEARGLCLTKKKISKEEMFE